MRKTLKRNLVIAAVLVFVGAAVYLNWSYNNRWGGADASRVAAEDAAAELASAEYAGQDAQIVETAYFDEARLTRQQARDESLSLLELACSGDDATEEVIRQSMEQINAIAAWNLTESLVENELKAKQFSDCVVMVSADAITVAVPAAAEGLSQTQVAQITETVVTNTDYTASQLNIIEVKD